MIGSAEANVSKNKKLASGMAVMIVAATVAGTSAFAESRPSEGTRSRGNALESVRGGSVSARGEVGRGNESRNGGSGERRSAGSTERRRESSNREGTVDRRSSERRSEGTSERRTERRGADRGVTGAYERRVEGRNQGTFDRRPDTSNDTRARNNARRGENRGSSGSYRNGENRGSNNGNRNSGNRNGDSRWSGSNRNNNNNDRGGSWNNNRGNNRGGSYNNNHSGNDRGYYHHGRVSNYHRYGNGYRVWIVGAPYPFYVPLAYWRADRFRIGLSIGLGGYYNDGGYYDYYEGYRDGAYNNNLHSEADFEGVVESVDWRRDTFVVRNEETGNFITVVLRDRDEEPVRPGDYVSVRGDWTTRGYFRAYDVDVLD